MMLPNFALYYPTIKFQNLEWLLTASLLWDRIYRIVPQDISTSLDEDYKIKKICETGEIGIAIDPKNYASTASKAFVKLKKIEDEIESIFEGDEFLIHESKIDKFIINELFQEHKYKRNRYKSKRGYISMKRSPAYLYMNCLADTIAKENNLSTVTDHDHSLYAMCSTQNSLNYENDLTDKRRELGYILIKDFLPANISDIPVKKILEFREKRKDERQHFLNSIKNASKILSEIKEEQIYKDQLNICIKNIEREMNTYKKSMDILNANTFIGITTSFFGLSNQFLNGNISPIGTTLNIGIIAMGLLSTANNLINGRRNIKSEYDYLYLHQLQNLER